MTKFNSWDEAAEHVVASIEWEVRTSGALPSAFEVVEKYISQWILGLQANDEFSKSDTKIVTELIIKCGVMALHEIKMSDIQYSHDNMVALLIRKQHDYGHDNINNFGVIGIAIRVCDKIARIRNLRERNTDGVAEPLADSYLDLVGYAAIAQMYQHGWFQLELKGDMK
jgi:hypothetical protein